MVDEKLKKVDKEIKKDGISGNIEISIAIKIQQE